MTCFYGKISYRKNHRVEYGGDNFCILLFLITVFDFCLMKLVVQNGEIRIHGGVEWYDLTFMCGVASNDRYAWWFVME